MLLHVSLSHGAPFCFVDRNPLSQSSFSLCSLVLALLCQLVNVVKLYCVLFLLLLVLLARKLWWFVGDALLSSFAQALSL